MRLAAWRCLRGTRGRPPARRRSRRRGRRRPDGAVSPEPAPRATCRRTSPPCCGSRPAPWISWSWGLHGRPSRVYPAVCQGARSSSLPPPAGLAKVNPPGENIERAVPLAPGERPMRIVLNSWRTRCSDRGAHSAQFLLHVNISRLGQRLLRRQHPPDPPRGRGKGPCAGARSAVHQDMAQS